MNFLYAKHLGKLCTPNLLWLVNNVQEKYSKKKKTLYAEPSTNHVHV